MGGTYTGVRTKALVTYVVLFIFFGTLYFSLGTALGRVAGFAHLNFLLNADHERVITDLTDATANHDRTDVHPLFVLFLNPVGVLLTRGLGSRLAAALVMNSAAGALCVVMTKSFLRRAGLSEFSAFLFAAILGLSATHIFFGSTPETWIFAAAGVILLFNLAVFAPGNTSRFLPASVFAFGMVTTNLVVAAVAYAAGMWKRITFKTLLVRTAVFGVFVAVCAAALSVVQKLLYPGSAIFILPEIYRLEIGSYSPIVKYFNGLTGAYLLARLAKLAAVFIIYTVVAPATVVRWYSAGEFCLPLKPYVNVDLSRLGAPGFVAAAFWVALIVWGAYSIIKNKENRTPVLFGLLLTLAFYLAFYFFYGTTMYVYAISTAFPLLGSVALALRPYDRPGTKVFYVLGGTLTCFLLLELVNNVNFLYRIFVVYRDYPFPISP